MSLTYDAAGNLTKDKDGYQYYYDYENRIVKITKDSNDKAEYTYDALGRRIKKYDSVATTTTQYYYNNNWPVLSETDSNNVTQRWYVYGNYVDEVLRMTDSADNDYYYVHDHLYSPAGLINSAGNVVERYEYDAYGDCNVLDANFADDADGISDYSNPYLFTGRRLDILDTGDLEIMYYRARYYDTETGRFISRDPIEYADGMNLYEYIGVI